MKMKDILIKENYIINYKNMSFSTIINSIKNNPKVSLTSISNNELIDIVQKLNYDYYIKGKSHLSDELYDFVKNELKNREPNNPLIDNIGVSKVYKTKLPHHMGSMDKIKSGDKSIINWLKKFNGNGYTISDKLDGISALYVKNEEGEKLYTRGDGKTGKDISYLIKFIKGLNKNTINTSIRGELIISKKNFKKIKSDDKVMNVRNIVSGVINSKKPNLQFLKYIRFISYEVIIPDNLTSKEQFKFLNDQKFLTTFNIYKENIDNESLSKLLEERRENSDYDIDGIIVTDNNFHKRNVDGNPKYSFAFKNIFTLNKIEVMVLNIEWNITKDKYLQPVVTFEPIEINGVMVKRATGKNAKFIKDNNIGPGSKLLIVRRGDVIPHIEEVLSDSDTGKPQMPEYDYEWNKTEVEIVLKDNINNKELVKITDIKNMENFVKKMEFDGISSGIITQLYNSGINTIYKFINITKKQLLNIEGIKEKKANNIIASIESTMKELDCIKLMMASNTFGRGFGLKKLELIMDNIKDKNFEKKPTLDELIKIKGVERTTAEKFIENIDKYLDFIKINKIECNFKEKQKIIDNPELKINVVFTGFRDNELEEFIKLNGGSIKTSISSNIDYLIIKDSDTTSSKIKKAKELNVKIITKEEFENKFKK
jgi:NAD-dependent DNA ligase